MTLDQRLQSKRCNMTTLNNDNKRPVGLLTDDMILNNPSIMYWIEYYEEQINDYGYKYASAVDKLNLAMSLKSEDDRE